MLDSVKIHENTRLGGSYTHSRHKTSKNGLRTLFSKISNKKNRFSLFLGDMIFWIIFSDSQKSKASETGVIFREAYPQLSVNFVAQTMFLS